jgi:uncharacterized protein (DUF2384 family)
LPKRQTNSRRQARAVALVDDPSVEVFMAAAAAFQGVDEGKRWLTMPSESFGNKPPLAEIGSEEGRKKILNELALIEHGMF